MNDRKIPKKVKLSDEFVDAFEATLDPEEREEFDRTTWGVVWEQAVLDGDLEGGR